VLSLATSEQRILVTFDVADCPPILRDWGEAGRSHSGVILIHGIRHNESGLVLTGVGRWLGAVPEDADWRDRAVVVDRIFAKT